MLLLNWPVDSNILKFRLKILGSLVQILIVQEKNYSANYYTLNEF